MLPYPPFPQFIPPRFRTAMNRLNKRIWQQASGPLPVAQTPPAAEHVPFDQGTAQAFTPVSSLPCQWGERQFDQCWWRIEIPAGDGDKTRYFVWRDQAEATLYIDGAPYYGLDSVHQYCPLPEGTREVHVESMCGNVGIWTRDGKQGVDRGGSRFEGAFLYTRNDAAWHAFHDLDVLIRLINAEHRLHNPGAGDITGGSCGFRAPLIETSPLVRKLIRRLNAACDVFDNEGTEAMAEALAAVREGFKADPVATPCTLTGHAHIDLVWLWTEAAGDFKAVHTFASMNRLMDLYPEFVFGYSQPASYEAVTRRSPALMAQVRERIASRRWEATGAFYVEADTQLGCGEALAMDLVLGQRGFEDLTGERSKVVWIPDVFGYSGSLPQLMRAAGAEYFFTQKLMWSSAQRFPYTSFVWRGNDGSEVLSYVLPAVSYVAQALPEELRELDRTHMQADVHHENLLPSGYGDGGGGPTEGHCERVRRMADLAGVPPARWGRIDEFYDRLNAVRSDLPVWKGEMYLEYHRGVQTTHGNLKASFRACERALQTWEAARCAAGGGAIDEMAWKRLTFAHFHDYIPGSSIQEVYDEGIAEMDAIAARALAESAGDLGGKGGGDGLFNPLPLTRQVVRDTPDGLRLLKLAPLAAAPLEEIENVFLYEPVVATTSSLENSRVSATFDGQGQVTSLVVDGTAVAQAGPLGQLHIFPDVPAAFEAWDIDRPTLSNGSVVDSPAEATLEQQGELTATIAFRRALTEKSNAVIRYTLDAESPVLQVEYDIEWNDFETLLKVAFPTDYQGQNARYAAPFGSALRPQQPGELKADAMFEVPASRWAVVADDAEADGLYVVTQDKYGFGCQAGLMHVSLLRSAYVSNSEINPEMRAVHREHNFSDIGRHVIRLAFGRFHNGLRREEQPAALADILYTAPLAYTGPPAETCFRGMEGGESLQPAWVKPVDGDTMILRLHETLGRRGKARLQLDGGWECTPVNLFGEPAGDPLPGTTVRFKPYQLISLALRRK